MQACSVDSDTKTCAGSYGACREAMLEILGEQDEDGVDVDADGGDGDDGRGGAERPCWRYLVSKLTMMLMVTMMVMMTTMLLMIVANLTFS